MNYQQTTREYQRISLESYSVLLAEAGFTGNLKSENEEDWVLELTVPGASRLPAKFSFFGMGEDFISLSAFFVSPLLDDGMVDIWVISQDDTPNEICNELIIPFIMECFDAEFGKLLVPTMVNDDNLSYFGPLLSDTVLDEENTYGLGVFIDDEGGLEIAGAAGFYVSEGNLVIENVNILPQYQDLNIDRYLVRYIKQMVVNLEGI